MRTTSAALALLLALFLSSTLQVQAAIEKHGQVTVSHKKEGDIQYVVGKIRINQPPERVWPIMANPFEFEHKISPKFKTVEVVADHPDLTILKCRVDIGFFLPSIKYTVESKYQRQRKIVFRSIGGDLKDFRGAWELEPAAGGLQTDVTYSMYVQPGIPVPQWLVRQGIKIELPHTLTGLSERVNQIYAREDQPVARRTAAAGSLPL